MIQTSREGGVVVFQEQSALDTISKCLLVITVSPINLYQGMRGASMQPLVGEKLKATEK